MNQFRPSTTPWEQPSQGAKRRRPSLPVHSIHFSGTGNNALSKEKKTTTSENKTNKKTTENVVMINGRSNDGHKKRCCAWRTQKNISDVAGVTAGVT